MWAFKFCGYDLVQYDYDGLSNTVLAERSPPYVRDAYEDVHFAFTGDRFVSTYLRGPLGVIARTAEKGNSDTSDNETHYYLADLMGNHVATVRDAGEGGDSSPSWQAYDAFGSALGKSGGLAGSLGWRGGEGSVSDRETGLVYMQSRHYDPSLGRFVQADTLPLASLTTQGANRYIYCENDPVNRSDPTGRAAWVLPLAVIVLGGLIAGTVNWFLGGSFFGGFWGGLTTTAAGVLFAEGLIGWTMLALLSGTGTALTSFFEGDSIPRIAGSFAIGCILGVIGGMIDFSMSDIIKWLMGQIVWYVFAVTWALFSWFEKTLADASQPSRRRRHPFQTDIKHYAFNVERLKLMRSRRSNVDSWSEAGNWLFRTERNHFRPVMA